MPSDAPRVRGEPLNPLRRGIDGLLGEDYTRRNAIDKDVERKKYALPRPSESVGHRLRAYAGTERGSRPGVVLLN